MANWESSVGYDKGTCVFEECIPLSASVPKWIDEFGETDDGWEQNGIDKSEIDKERPYINCGGWEPRSKDYDHTGWPDKHPRSLLVYGRRYSDDKTVGNAQVDYEEKSDGNHKIKSDKTLQFKAVTGVEYIILIPKKLKNNLRYGHAYELNKREGDPK
jgi:hypothetical protein